MKYRILNKGNEWVWPGIAETDLRAVDCVSPVDERFETADINLAYRYMDLLMNSSAAKISNWDMEVKERK